MRVAVKILSALMLLVLSLRINPCAGKRSTKDWSKMNLDDLEKQWEDGDEEEELKTENQARFERLEKRRKAAAGPPGSFDPSTFNKMDVAEIGALAAGQKDATGPTMMFADVGSGMGESGPERGGATLTKEATEEVGGRLQTLAKLGGLDLTVYAIDPGSVLVSTQRGWEGKQVLDFLLSRPEVTKVTWNSKDFLPPVGEDEL